MRSPRYLLALIAAAILIAGCGGDDEAASALDEALGYLPEDAGFVFIASTDTGDYEGVERLVDKFPFGGRVTDSLSHLIAAQGIDYEDDVKPLLGNYVVIGVPDNAAFVDSGADTPFVMALETRDADALEELAKRDSEDRGETEGYDVYQGQEDDTWLAVKDEVVVLSDSEATLEEALKQRGEDDRLTEEDVEAAFEDLPDDAPLRAYVNVEALLAADPDTQDALKVEWVDHVETLGVAADAGEDEVALDYVLRTDSEGLTDDDLPLAAGDEAPQVFERDGAEVVFGLRDPARVVDFGLAAAQAIDPSGFGQFEAGKEQIGKRLGVNVDADVIDQLTGDLAAVATLDGKFGIRAAVEDGPAFERTLAKVMKGLPEFADGVTVTEPARRETLYGVATAGGQTYTLGVVDGAFIFANDAALAGEVATRPLVDAGGQQGAFVLAVDAEQLANELLAKLGSGIQALGGSLFTGPLGQITSSASAETDGIRGELKLGID